METSSDMKPFDEHLKHIRNLHNEAKAEGRFLPENEEEKILKNLSRDAGIPPLFACLTFDDFDVSSEKQKKAIEVCEKYCDKHVEIMKAGWNLLLAGPPGAGKTHVMATIAYRFALKGHSVLFITAYDLRQMIMNTWCGDRSEKERVKARLNGVELLCIDGVEERVWPDVFKEIFYEIVDARYLNKKPIAMTSNMAILKKQDSRASISLFLGEQTTTRMQQRLTQIIFDWENHRLKPTEYNPMEEPQEGAA